MKSKPNLFARTPITLTAFVALAMVQSTRAATIYWDGTGTSWNTTPNWSTASGATTPDPAAVPGVADVANFNISTLTTSQAITLDAAQSVLGLSFLSTSTGGVTINAGTGGAASTLTLGTSGIAIANGSGANTINSNIVLGPGAQTWTNNDTDTLTIGGTVTRNVGTTLGFAGTGTVTSSTAFANDSAGILGNWATFGTGTSMKYATKNGSNVIVGLTGTSAANADAFVSASANYDFTTTGTTTLSSSRTANTIHYLTGNGNTINLGASGANTLTLNGILATGTGTLTIQRTGGTGSVVIGSSNELVIAGSQAVTISAPVSGVGKALTYSGAGTFTLSGANTYSGATTINSGRLNLGAVGALGDATNHTSGLTINGGAIFDLAGFSPTYGAPLILNSTANSNDTGAFLNSGSLAVTYSGTVELKRQTRFGGSGAILLNNTITGGGFNFIKDSTGLLQLQNSGTVTLGALQGNRGTVQVDSGTTLNVTSIDIGTGGSVGAGLTLNGGSVTSTGQARFGQGSGSASGSLTLNSGTLTVPALTKGSLTFNANFNGGTLKASGDSGTFFSSATLARVQTGGAFIDDGGFAINIGQTLTPDYALRGGGLTKQGGGTLTLSGPNTYVGTTTVNGGTLKAGNNSALGFGGVQTTATAGANVNNDYTLDLNGMTVNEPLTLNGLGVGNNGALINSSGATATVGNGIAGLTIGSAAGTGSGYTAAPTVSISGNGATATASLGLTAASITGFGGTASGWAVGDLVNIIGGNGSGAVAYVTAVNGSAVPTAVNFSGAGASPGAGYTAAPTGWSRNTSAAGSVTSGTLTANATSFTVAGVAMTAAGSGYTGTPTYSFGSGNAVAGAVTLSSVMLASDSSIGGSGDIIINAVVGESASGKALTKVGGGIVTLAGANTYSGATTVSAGTLILDRSGSNTGALGASAVSVGGSGTLFIKGSTSIASGGSLATSASGAIISLQDASINTLTVNGGLTLATGSNLKFELGASDGLNDLLAVGAVSTAGTSNLGITAPFGLAAGATSYTLITASGGLSADNFQISSKPAGFNTFSLSTPTDTALLLGVQANATPTTAYWTGLASQDNTTPDAGNNWGYGSALEQTKSNWSTTADGLSDPLQVPGATTGVILTASNAIPSSGNTLTTQLDAGYSIKGLTIDVPTLAGTQITSTIINPNGNTLTLGSDGLTLTSTSLSSATLGTGAIQLGASQNWTNDNATLGLTVNSGITAVSGATTLTLNGTGAGGVTLGGVIGNGGGTLALAKSGSGTLILSGANTYTGGTSVSAGTLSLTGSLTGSNVSTSGTGVFSQSGSGSVAGTGVTFTQGSSATSVLNGSNTYTGATIVSGGTLEVGGAIGSGGGTAVTTSNAGTAFNVTSTNGLTGTSSLTVGTGSTATLSAANNYSGATSVSGALQLRNAGSTGSSAVTLNSGGTLQLRADNNTTFSPVSVGFAGSGSVNYNFNVDNITGGTTGKTLTLANVATQFGPAGTTDVFNITGGNGYTLAMGSGAAGTGGLNIWNNTTINSNTSGVTLQIAGGVNVNFALSYSLGFGGAGNISIGALTRNAANNLTPTFGGSGTITLNGSNNFGATTGVISTSGTLNLNNANGLTGLAALTISGAATIDNITASPITLSGNPTQNWNSNFTFGGTTGLNLGTGNVTMNASRQVTVNGTGALTVGGAISGSGFDLTKVGAGTLTLSGTNTYTGTTTIKAGTLGLTSTGTISNSGNLIVGDTGSTNAVLDVTAKTSGFTIGSAQKLSGIGTVDANTSATVGGVDGTKYTVTVNGIHAAGNSVGKQTIDGSVDYAASTTIFEWELATNVDSVGWDHDNDSETANLVGARGTNFDAVDVTGSLAINEAANTGAIFKVILGTDFDGTNPFWTADRSWNVFNVSGSSSTAFTNFQLFNASAPTTEITSATYSPYGSFGYSFGSGTGTLTWSAVPEPTSALAGLLLTAGLLRRRRK